jgi:DNA ligase-1
MKNFASLFTELDQTNKTNDKIAILTRYLGQADDADKVWALALLSGKRPKRQVNTTFLRTWAMEVSGVAPWLFEESYHVVGDLAETISLLLPPPGHISDKSLTEWMAFLQTLPAMDEGERKEHVVNAWDELTTQERLVFIKLMTGEFRIGVSQNLVIKALSNLTGKETPLIAHQLMGKWNPAETSFEALMSDEQDASRLSRPYPFFLAYAIEDTPDFLGSPQEWQAEWKWDGIRSQTIKRQGELFIWSRGEDLITEKFPELLALKKELPDGTVIDGEILPFLEGKIMPFSVLQTRIGRKNITAKYLKEAPIIICAYDLLEWQGRDIRSESLADRRILLEQVINTLTTPVITYSDPIRFSSWEELTKIRTRSRENFAEGLMLKRLASTYQTGRKRGDWWKWKIEPLTVDGVLIYAQKGHGRRADLFTDYTFGVWQGDTLVPFAKAYSGLTDKEIKQVDTFIRKNTYEKFGPVRTVKPELVFEIAFEGIQASSRHKSGVAVRFPRILRWRHDKPASEADTIGQLHALLKVYSE